MDHSLISSLLDFADSFDPFGGLRMGDCPDRRYWWVDECWYTEDEKDDMAASAYWHRYMAPRPKRMSQKKYEWLVGGPMTWE